MENRKQKIANFVIFEMDAFFDVAMSEEKAMVWAEMLQSYSMEEIKDAFRDHIAKHGAFKPTLAAVVYELEQGRKGKDTTKEDLSLEAIAKWDEVIEAIHRYGSEGFNTLDPLTQNTVRAVGGYQRIQMSDVDKALPFLRKSFLEEYVCLAQRNITTPSMLLTQEGSRILNMFRSTSTSSPGQPTNENVFPTKEEIDREKRRILEEDFMND